MHNTTVIYYTSNKEDPVFEQKIRDRIKLAAGDLPIVSVSQQPIDFGHNIVVGDVGASNFNLYRQIQIACENATTPFVVSAEADCVYPPDYFQFIPPQLDECYRNSNIYILHDKEGFYKKQCSAFSQIVGREYYLDRLKTIFEGMQEWDSSSINWPGEIFKSWTLFSTINPCVSFKTGNGLRKFTALVNNTKSKSKATYDKFKSISDIPYWGFADDLREELLWEQS